MRSQRFWPACDAILSNPGVSLHLLVEAALNPEIDELLRLRAVGFLMVMNKPLIEKLILNKIEPEIARKIQCMIETNAGWHGASVNICENYERYKKMMREK